MGALVSSVFSLSETSSAMKTLALVCLLAGIALAQKKCSQKENVHLPMDVEIDGSSESLGIVLDSNWRWTHVPGDTTNCYTGNLWDESLCPDAATCTQNCGLDGVDNVDWEGTYGVTSEGASATLKFVTEGPYSRNVGSRNYLMDTDGKNYKLFYLKNREWAQTVDVSNLNCGLNGAAYFVEMDKDGGLSHEGNECGAEYGTGYCDAQCPHDMKWINGEANCEDWQPSDSDPNAGTGHYGTCCVEMDIWEANNMANSYTPHVCDTTGAYRCEGTECGDIETDERYEGVCDKDGCDYALYRLGNKDFYGPGLQVDSDKPLTLITQFITSDGTDDGDLVEIRRSYIQDGKVFENPAVKDQGDVKAYDSVTDGYCHDIKEYYKDHQDFDKHGALKAMGDALGRGMVFVMSLWDDHYAHMLWLDAIYPTDVPEDTPGVVRGPCPKDGGDPEDVEAEHPDASVTFSDLKIGPIGSTYPHLKYGKQQ